MGTTAQSYSLSIWIKPNSVLNGTIIHASSGTDGVGWCIPMIGFTNNGRVGAQSWSGGIVPLTGPTVLTNVWTHVAVTYSSTNGLRLFVNGSQYGSATGGFSYITANTPMVLTLGSPINGTACATSVIVPNQYSGYLDELQVYSRELNANEILTLANP